MSGRGAIWAEWSIKGIGVARPNGEKRGRGRSGNLRLGQPYEISESCGEIKSVLCVCERPCPADLCKLIGGPDNH